MNKIYNTFSNITASDELKEKTYQRIIKNNKSKSSKKINLFHLSLAMTSIIICVFIYSISDNKNNNLNTTSETEIDLFNTQDNSNNENDFIIYNDKKYIYNDSIVIEESMLDKIISYTDNEVKSLPYSTPIYSIKNIDKTLRIAIINDNKVLVFVGEN